MTFNRTVQIIRIVPVIVLCLAGAAFGAEDDALQAELDFANGLFNRGFFEEAVDQYQAYIDAADDGAAVLDAWFRLGQAAYASRQYEKAVTAFDKVLTMGGDEIQRREATLTKGESLYFLKQYEAARKTLTPLDQNDIPESIRARAGYYLGNVERALNRQPEAVQHYKKVVEQCPKNAIAPYAQYQLASLYAEMGELENAAVAFSAVAGSKADADLRMESQFRAAEIYDKIGWFSTAVGAYEQLKTDFPDSAYARRAEYGYAWALYHSGKYAEAAAAANTFLTQHGSDPTAVGIKYLLGNCLQQQQKYAEALTMYAALSQDHPDSEFATRAQYKQAWVLYLKGDKEQAKAQAMTFLKSKRDTDLVGEVGFLLGTMLMEEGNLEDAHQEFRLVAEKYADSDFGAEALFRSAECMSRLGMTDEAAKIYETFVRKYPDHTLTEQAILNAGDAEFGAQDFQQAIAKYEKIVAESQPGTVQEQALYRLAITFHNMKEYKKSADTFMRMLNAYPESEYVSEAWFRVGEYQLREVKDALKAIEAYEAALAAKPGDSIKGRALRGLALARYERKDFDKAAELFAQLMKAYPEVHLNEETYAWTGQHFLDEKQWETTVTVFNAMLDKLPEYPYRDRVGFKIGDCLEKAGKLDQALAAYAKVVEENSSSSYAVQACYRMARLYEGRKDMDKAVALYEQAANTNNSDAAARARFRLGELYEAKGEFSTAARSYMRVAILFLHEELSPKALWRAGQCFEQMENTEQARKTYEEIVADYPGSTFAAQAKEALEKLGTE